jgi:hypothetical protein
MHPAPHLNRKMLRRTCCETHSRAHVAKTQQFQIVPKQILEISQTAYRALLCRGAVYDAIISPSENIHGNFTWKFDRST